MALQWMILAYVVAAEAALAVVLTLPSPKLIRSRIVSIISLILQPSLFVIPFAGFQLMGMCPFGILFFILSSSLVISRVLVGAILIGFWFWLMLDIYWKNEHRLMCTGEVCTASERDRYEKAVFRFYFNLV